MKDYSEQWQEEVRLNAKLKAELSQAREEVEILLKRLGEATKLAEKAIFEWKPRAEKAEAELYLETVKNNSDKARVEFLEDKWSEWTEHDPAWFDMSFQEHAKIMKDGREKAEAELTQALEERDELARVIGAASVRLYIVEEGQPLTGPQVLLIMGCIVDLAEKAEADSKRYREALEKVGGASCSAHYCGIIAQQALIDTEGKGGA